MGVARKVGLVFPAMMTRILGRRSASSVIPGLFPSPASPDGVEWACFRCEHMRRINAIVMSPNIRAKPPNRYGIGEFSLQTVLLVVEFVLTGLISLSPFFFSSLSLLFFSLCIYVSLFRGVCLDGNEMK